MKDLNPNKRSTKELIKLMNNPTAEELEQNPNMNDEAPVTDKYGFMFQEYLKTNYPGRVTELALATTLWDICVKVDEEATEMMWILQEQLREQNPPPKTDDFLKKVQYNTGLRDTAEEIVLREVVYKYR